MVKLLPWSAAAHEKITLLPRGRVYADAVQASYEGKNAIAVNGLEARKVKTARGWLWIVGAPVKPRTPPPEVRLIVYPEAEHAEAFVAQAPKVRGSGPAEAHPGGVGTLDMWLRTLKKDWSFKLDLLKDLRKARVYLHESGDRVYTMRLVQAHFKTRVENPLSGALVNKVSKWRPRVIQEALRIAAEQRADFVVDSTYLTRMKNSYFFFEVLRGLCRKNGLEFVQGKRFFLVKTSALSDSEKARLLG
jgi:hypothetical protein